MKQGHPRKDGINLLLGDVELCALVGQGAGKVAACSLQPHGIQLQAAQPRPGNACSFSSMLLAC